MLKRTLALSLLALAGIALIATDVDAGRLGGGRSFGAQRNVAPAPVQPATPQAPANAGPAQPANQNVASAPKAQTPPAPAPTPPAGSRWLAPLVGIAAGLGLAALLSHFGLSADFGGVLLAIVAVVAVVFILRRLLARPAMPRPALQPALQYAAVEPVRAPTSIGARETTGAVPPRGATARIPADFDAASFLAQARIAFNRLQAAFDAGDRRTLSDMMTPEMYAEVSRDLEARGDQPPTEVVKLDAEVAEVVTEGDRHWASVRFSGLLREDGNPLPSEFDELWHLTKPVDGSHGWLLAGIRQTQEALQ